MARAWHLKSRPQGMPTLDNFELRETELPALEDGSIPVEAGNCAGLVFCVCIFVCLYLVCMIRNRFNYY